MKRRYLAVAAERLWALIIAACAAVGPAYAQSAVLVSDSDLCDLFPDSTCYSPDDGADFADQAFTSLATAGVDTLEVLEGTFSLTTVPMLGVNGPDSVLGLGAPHETILNAALTSSPTIEISGAGVVIEAVTLSGGTNGIHVLSSATDAKINRVQILGASEDGILVSGAARIVNVSVSGSGRDGIRVDSTVASFTEIVLSTILNNAENGVNVVNVAAITDVLGCNITGNGSAGFFGILGTPATVADNGNNLWENGDPGNPADEYGGAVPPGPASINSNAANIGGVDPGYDPAPDWQGQIDAALAGASSPNIIGFLDTAVIGGPLTGFDFDGDVRPQGLPLKKFEIGADEINNDPSASRAWIFCEVTPDPAGRLPQNQLFVRLRITGLPDGTFPELDSGFAGVPNKVVIVPYQSSQLGVTVAALVADEADISIPLTVFEAASNFYIGTNAVPLQSPLNPDTTLLTYLDGPAQVVVLIQGIALDPFPGSQAINGRNFDIDTIPPRLYVPFAGAAAGYFFENPIISHNDILTTASSPPLPADTTIGARISTSAILPTKGSTSSASIFFNVGAPPAIQSDLEITIRTQFYDPLPDPTAVPPEWNSAVALPPASAGFDPSLTGSVTIDTTELTNPSALPFMPRWRLDDGTVVTTSGSLVAEFSDAGDLNGDSVNDLQVLWHFRIADGNAVPFTAANVQGFLHWAMRFQGMDLAGNIATDQELLQPLHMWWMLGARTQLKPYVNEEVDHVDFSWGLKPPPQVTSNLGVGPLFAYHLLKLTDNAPDNDGPYVALDGGEAATIGLNGSGQDGLPWYLFDERTGIPFDDPSVGFSRIFTVPGLEGLQDRWLLLIVVGRDEAGNYEPFPTLEPNSGLESAGGAIVATAQSGRNWQRFKLSAASAIDTEAAINFWHDEVVSGAFDGEMDPGESVFGSVRLVPLPPEDAFGETIVPMLQRVDAKLLITVTTPDMDLNDPDPDLTTVRLSIRGGEIDLTPPDFEITQKQRTIGLMDEVLAPNGVNWLGDIQRKTPITYQVTIATVLTVDGIEQVDETPVNISFTVVANVQDYIQNKTSPDEQPVKSVETS